ncbi:MAG: zinc-dependent metalloprotease [Bacteroidaceae bacterium]|nr:zinc-dependent metalloprotease [Bacteroidaceae bacterium]
MSLKRNILAAGLIAAFLLGGNCMPVSARKNNPEKTEKTSKESKGKQRKFLFFKRKSKKAEAEKPAPPSAYKQLTGRDSLAMSGVMNVISKGDTVYLELPANLLGKPFLVSNKLQQVPAELNEASANKGINYANQMVRFEWDKKEKTVKMRQQRVTPEVPENSYLARSVADNYLDPIIASMKVEGVSPDSASVIFKVSDFFNGKKNVLNDVFNDINIGTSPLSELSRIVSVKAYDRSVVAKSELTTTVREGMSKVNVTVVVSTAICLLPEVPMDRRREDWRVGYFSTPSTIYNDEQQRVEHTSYITRWRLEPKDTAAYLRGELTEPVKPIDFYIGGAVPEHLRPYIIKGITDWNKAFERAGFKNAVRAIVPDDTLDVEGDDMHYSVLTYAASEKANAMGPSTIDPRTGEILEADIIWWHNVQSLISEWITVQTGAVDPRARSLKLPIELIGDAVRFVACHEVGHSLGLRHNMMASAAYPTDSLRSESFTSRMGGTSASIMDYARFNYVAQPGDNVKVMSPNIGPYDLMAIEWGYRWYPDGTNEDKALSDLLGKYKGKEYRYSEAQPQRSAVDPRALSEDLGDDPVKSARLGVENLKRVMPNLIEWTRNNKPGQNYDEAGNLYAAVIFQWSLYHYHVMANIGGIYMERPNVDWHKDPEKQAYIFVEKERQKEAVQFLLDEVLCFPEWLFGSPFSTQVFPLRKTPLGTTEQEPAMLLKNQQNYILWDLLANDRLVRMYQNEWMNGEKAFTAVEMIQMLHESIFKKTIAGKKLNVMERSLQKSFVDALITAAAESEGVKINKSLDGEKAVSGSGSRTIDMTMTQITRNSDALSVKRSELIRIMKLLKSKAKSGDLSTQMHYDDVVLRIQTALGLQK